MMLALNGALYNHHRQKEEQICDSVPCEATAVNWFESGINRTVSPACPFCWQRNCFTVLSYSMLLFSLCLVFFVLSWNLSYTMFFLGCRYSKMHKDKRQLFDFIEATAERNINVGCRQDTEQTVDVHVVLLKRVLRTVSRQTLITWWKLVWVVL